MKHTDMNHSFSFDSNDHLNFNQASLKRREESRLTVQVNNNYNPEFLEVKIGRIFWEGGGSDNSNYERYFNNRTADPAVDATPAQR